MSGPLFDPTPRALRRARAERIGGGDFLVERAFADCLDRIGAVSRSFRRALVHGEMRPSWPSRLQVIGVKEVIALDPAAAMPPDADLCLSIGAMDTAEPLPAVLGALRFALAPDALLIGAFAGGESLPVLRQAMRAADQVRGVAAAHVHPRIGAASFASLLSEAGFAMPVVDIDRVRLRYADFDALVRDLRAMAATNRLIERPRMPIMRAGRAAARDLIASLAVDGRTTETIEIIHFAAWTPGNRE